uniref:Uncharacterized protein n=1 Tax=viral metagenome TaxID=1070528 RepID=A0A6M3KZD1_9ZZZZ
MVDAWDVIKYVVLPVTVVGAIWIIFTKLFSFGSDALKHAAETLAYMWDDYMREEEDFLANDGSISTSEQAILDSKAELMRPIIEGMANAIPDPNQIILELGILVSATIIAYEALKGAFNIKANLKSFIGTLKSRVGSPDPASDTVMSFGTPEELTMIFRISTIMEIADLGNTSLASNLLSAEQTNYFNNMLPQMQFSYNFLASQLSVLTGSQLAMAQFHMMQYSMYLNYYTAALPPLFTFIPPIMPF